MSKHTDTVYNICVEQNKNARQLVNSYFLKDEINPPPKKR